jgi:alkanesulfonate monooxygenase SsuD/methylene tetrahydromethanopterin reductase-like flavin-dependent oxidoreductase (luciferase family)
MPESEIVLTNRSEQLHVGIHIDGAGRHPAAWRVAGAQPDRLFDADYFVEIAQLAERGLLDFVALEDSFRLESNRSDHVRGKLDALLTMARLAPKTSSIGLVASVTTTHTEPFHVSKNVATLDFVSNGRAGWSVDVSATDAEAFHFGRRGVAPVADLYDESAEAIDVVRQLWDSWEDDAVIRDVATGRYIDRTRLHYTNFEGRHFSVRGPSITPRSPQGQSLVFFEAVNEHALAAAIVGADVIVVDVATIEAARDLRMRIEDGLAVAGRDGESVKVLVVIDVHLDDTETQARATRAHLDLLAAPLPATLDFVGTAAGLADLFEQWAAADVVDGFVVRPAILPVTLQRLVGDVVPLLQARGLFRTAYEGPTLRDRFGLPRPVNRYAGVSR